MSKTNKTIKLSKRDFLFASSETNGKVEFDADTRKLKGTAYSGGIVEDHWMFERLIIDLANVKYKPAMPCLRDHDTGLILGSGQISVANSVEAEADITDVTEAGKEVIALSDAKFPWEMSIYCKPKSIDFIDKGSSAVVNGLTVEGPIHVWRNNTIKEFSLVVFGADSNTSANVFSEEITMTTEIKDKENPTPEELAAIAEEERIAAEEKAAKDKADKEAADKAAADVMANDEKTKEFSAKITALEETVKALTEENKKFKEEKVKAVTDSRMLKLSACANVSDDQKKILCALEESAFDAMLSVLKTAKPAKPSYLFRETGGDDIKSKYKFEAGDVSSLTKAADALVADRTAAGQPIDFDTAVKALTANS